VVAGQFQVAERAFGYAGRGVVPSEDGGGLFFPAGAPDLPRPGGAPVQVAALRAQQPAVRCLLDEGVPEPVAGVGRAGDLPDEVPGPRPTNGAWRSWLGWRSWLVRARGRSR